MFRSLALCCLALVALPASAAAEWHFTPMLGVTFAGKTTLQDFEGATGDIHPALGIAVTFLTGGLIGAEAIGEVTPGFFQKESTIVEKSRSSALMGNVVIAAPRRLTEYSLRPFASGGLGLLRTSQTDKKGVLPVTSNVAGFNIGGGAIGFLTKSTGVRFDVRYFSNLHGVDQGGVAIGDVHLRYMTASVGVVIRR